MLCEPDWRRDEKRQLSYERGENQMAFAREGRRSSPPLMDRMGVSSLNEPPAASTEMEELSMPSVGLCRTSERERRSTHKLPGVVPRLVAPPFQITLLESVVVCRPP